MFEGLDQMYFKVRTKLIPGKFECLPGYAELKPGTQGWIDYNGETLGYVQVEKREVSSMNIKDKNDKKFKVHPFQFVAFNSLQHERSDIDYMDYNSGGGLVQQIKAFRDQLSEIKEGYEAMIRKKGFGNKVAILDSKYPSYVRLNTPRGKKFGGGYRVKEVTISDEASALGYTEDSKYGVRYHYINEDGTSSGVTTSEPALLKEESPFRLPTYYSSFYDKKKPKFDDKELYNDHYLGEEFFQNAEVGYARVISENIVKDGSGNDIIIDSKVNDGVIVKSYYTAKDYPVEIETEFKAPKHNWYELGLFHVTLPVPLGNDRTHESFGFSQGVLAKINDMHGEAKERGKVSLCK